MADETNPPRATWTVEKGKKFLIEIEMTKDMDMYRDASILLRSLYQGFEINDEFKVTVIHFRGMSDIVNDMRNKITNTIDEYLNGIH